METSPAAGVQTAAAAPRALEHDSGALLRALAHELRQPLSAIDSISYYLDLVLPREDTRARDQAARLHGLVQQSSLILSCALDLADTRPPRPQLLSIEELLTQTMAAVRAGTADPQIRLNLAGELPAIPLDPQRGMKMIEHVLGLLAPMASDEHPAHFSSRLLEGSVLLEASIAPSSSLQETSLPAGAGMAIESIRKAAAAHGGSFTFQVDPVSGLRGRLMLPLDSANSHGE
jgi:hypothetical protein